MIKVYFGPYKHSPVGELSGDERRLWLSEFGLLKGVDTDFWTNNHMALDMFSPSQIMLWDGERWVTLPAACEDLLPEKARRIALADMPPGRLALLCEVKRQLRRQESEARNDDPPTEQ